MPKAVPATELVFTNSSDYQFQALSRTRINVELKMMADEVSKARRYDGFDHGEGCVSQTNRAKGGCQHLGLHRLYLSRLLPVLMFDPHCNVPPYLCQDSCTCSKVSKNPALITVFFFVNLLSIWVNLWYTVHFWGLK